jgi:hypothetical protein
MTALNGAARDYVAAFLGMTDISMISDERVRKFIDSDYPGGWDGFARAYAPVPPPVSTAPTLYQQLAEVLGRTGWTFRPHHMDEVMSVTLTPTKTSVLVRRYRITETARRFRVTETGYQLIVWSPADPWWKLEGDITLWKTDENFDVHRFGRITDLTRLIDDMDQYETCYRPGTASTPMDSPYGPTREHDYSPGTWLDRSYRYLISEKLEGYVQTDLPD